MQLFWSKKTYKIGAQLIKERESHKRVKKQNFKSKVI